MLGLHDKRKTKNMKAKRFMYTTYKAAREGRQVVHGDRVPLQAERAIKL